MSLPLEESRYEDYTKCLVSSSHLSALEKCTSKYILLWKHVFLVAVLFINTTLHHLLKAFNILLYKQLKQSSFLTHCQWQHRFYTGHVANNIFLVNLLRDVFIYKTSFLWTCSVKFHWGPEKNRHLHDLAIGQKNKKGRNGKCPDLWTKQQSTWGQSLRTSGSWFSAASCSCFCLSM